MTVRLNRRSLLRSAGLASAAGLLAACQPKIVEVTKVVKEIVKETVVVEKIVEKQVPAEQKVVVRYHTRASGIKPPDDQFPVHQNRLSEFRQEHPEIEVVIEGIAISSLHEYYVKLATMVAGGTVGDMTWDHQSDCDHQRLAYEGVFAPVDEFMERDGVKESEWWAAAMQNAKFEGKIYGLPMCAHPGCEAFLYYNKDMWDKAGLPLPQNDGYTMSDVREAAIELSTGPVDGRDVYGFMPHISGSQSQEGWMRAFGAYSFVDESGTKTLMDAPAGLEWAKFCGDLYNADGVAPHAEAIPAGGTYAMFDAGKLASFQTGSWAYKTVRKVVGNHFEVGTVMIPPGPGARASGNYLDCFALLSAQAMGSPVKDEAWMLLNAYTDARCGYLQLSLSGQLCARPDAFDALCDDSVVGEMVTLFQRSISESKPQFSIDNFRGAEHATTLNNVMDKIWIGEQEPTQAYMDSVGESMQKILDKPR